jgi:hypothetical protein
MSDTTTNTEELEVQEIAALREVAAFAKSKGLKLRWASDTYLGVGTNDHRAEHGKAKVSDQQIPLGDRQEGRPEDRPLEGP